MQGTFLCPNKNGLIGPQHIFVLLFTLRLENFLIHLCNVFVKKEKHPDAFYFT